MDARKIKLASNEIYHVFNRGVEKRITFTNKYEYRRALDTMDYYRYRNNRISYSKFIKIERKLKQLYLSTILEKQDYAVDILAYCLMPNHFHFLLKQKNENGITNFVSKFTNSYTKYFNKKHKRVGPLFQGTFKAVHIEDTSQLLHVARYIHLNPIASFLIDSRNLERYLWSSYQEYLDLSVRDICMKEEIRINFKNSTDFKEFTLEQIDYSQERERIKHLIIE